ncbi:hypothetical protein [Psittacicella gerlachiana]|uniref:Uncharacterized protein n=1 Tax=Psittacicella gerlachiana TaxID=2028574 RepID=A0A3A1YDK6_9GAMM|nr:hypothetical protein [Psittacicella gerlachiana]RIY35486.1 hypothetical protein CKF59_03570 [Psittacicella gerlachiana]
MSEKEFNAEVANLNCKVEMQAITQELENRLEAANQGYQKYNLDDQGNFICSQITSPDISSAFDLEDEMETISSSGDAQLNEFVTWLDKSVTQEVEEQAVYALVRFSNEIVTLKQSLNSLLPTINRGILITHPTADGLQDDGSLQVAAEFVQQNPGFKLVIYPYPVFYENHPIYNQPEKIKRENYLDAYTNYALEALKELAVKNGDHDPWVFRADADQIYDADLLAQQLEQILKVPSNHFKVNYFVKLDLHYEPESNELYYLRTKLKSSNFLVKAKYIRVGMVIENKEQATLAKEVYFFEDQEHDKFTFKQSLKGLGNLFKFRFMKQDTKNTFKAGLNHHYHGSMSDAQRYALHTMREIPANYTGFLHAVHFKYLKYVHNGNCAKLPCGLSYTDFLNSASFAELSRKAPELKQSLLFNSPELLLSYCRHMDFRKAHEFKALRDFYAQLRLNAKAQE